MRYRADGVPLAQLSVTEERRASGCVERVHRSTSCQSAYPSVRGEELSRLLIAIRVRSIGKEFQLTENKKCSLGLSWSKVIVDKGVDIQEKEKVLLIFIVSRCRENLKALSQFVDEWER